MTSAVLYKSMVLCRVYYATVHTSKDTDTDKHSVQRMLSLAEERKIDLEVSHNVDCKIYTSVAAQLEAETDT